MQVKGWVRSQLQRTPTGRTGRYYELTDEGRIQLGRESESFLRAAAATTRVLRSTSR